MIHYPPMSPAPTQKETIWGLVLMGFTLFIAPSLLYSINGLLPQPLSLGMLNIAFYCFNFLASIIVFHKFLAQSFKTAFQRLFPVIWYAILGYCGYQVLSRFLSAAILYIDPNFTNVNDENIFEMLGSDLVPLSMATVFLVPLAEEVIYRGLIFRKLFDRSPLAAYLISMMAFAAIHVMGYIGSYAPLVLLLCFLQYLPAGYCLCWCYRQTGTIACPILMHMLVNGISIFYYLR